VEVIFIIMLACSVINVCVANKMRVFEVLISEML